MWFHNHKILFLEEVLLCGVYLRIEIESIYVNFLNVFINTNSARLFLPVNGKLTELVSSLLLVAWVSSNKIITLRLGRYTTLEACRMPKKWFYNRIFLWSCGLILRRTSEPLPTPPPPPHISVEWWKPIKNIQSRGRGG